MNERYIQLMTARNQTMNVLANLQSTLPEWVHRWLNSEVIPNPSLFMNLNQGVFL
jgi:hypothetical protein